MSPISLFLVPILVSFFLSFVFNTMLIYLISFIQLLELKLAFFSLTSLEVEI